MIRLLGVSSLPSLAAMQTVHRTYLLYRDSKNSKNKRTEVAIYNAVCFMQCSEHLFIVFLQISSFVITI